MLWTSALIYAVSSSFLVAAVNPRFIVPGDQGKELDYSDNEQAVVAHNFSVKWRVNDNFEGQHYYDIILFQQDLEQNQATVGLPIISSRHSTPFTESFEWLVTPQRFDLAMSNIFFLGLLYDLETNDTGINQKWSAINAEVLNPYDGFDAQYFCMSHYFNISVPSPSPISNVSQATSSTNINTQPSKVLPVALGLGLGLGLPLIALSAFMLIMAYRRKRSTKTCAGHPPDLNMTTGPFSPGSHHSTQQGSRSNPSYRPFSDLEVVNHSHDSMTRSPKQRGQNGMNEADIVA